jgi:hypothetical protein
MACDPAAPEAGVTATCCDKPSNAA